MVMPNTAGTSIGVWAKQLHKTLCSPSLDLFSLFSLSDFDFIESNIRIHMDLTS
jgi:hypothetical protein